MQPTASILYRIYIYFYCFFYITKTQDFKIDYITTINNSEHFIMHLIESGINERELYSHYNIISLIRKEILHVITSKRNFSE